MEVPTLVPLSSVRGRPLRVRLGVGFRVYARIFYDEAPDALTIPRTCLFRGDAGQWHVLAVRDGLVQRVAVSVGLTTEQLVQITSGLSADDSVVAHPSREIEPGMRVKTVRR